MDKERRWRIDLEGWDIIKPEEDAIWDERSADALRIFDYTSPDTSRKPDQ
jgi:import inner membrane translocase subunit TIM54